MARPISWENPGNIIYLFITLRCVSKVGIKDNQFGGPEGSLKGMMVFHSFYNIRCARTDNLICLQFSVPVSNRDGANRVAVRTKHQRLGEASHTHLSSAACQ